jgi:hypothetical protein
MPAVNKVTLFLTGKIHWAKILGQPRPNYGGDAREWVFEFEPNEQGLQKIIQNGLADRIKGKGYNIGMKGQHAEREPFLTLKKKELNPNGEPNPPIRVYNADNEEWDQNTLIGNATVADVKLDVRDYGPGKKKGVYPVAVRVKELVAYQSSEFGGMDDGDGAPVKTKKSAKKDTFREDFGLEELNDDVPL